MPENTVKRNPKEVAEHASYITLGEKWVSACDLEKGDKVLLSDGKYGIVKEVKTKECKEYITYNFEVEDYHTYYVGKNSVLVHNACQTPNQKALTELIKENGKSNPISMSDAETLVTWGSEYNMPIRIDMGHSVGSAVSRAPHLHTGFNGWHIPIIWP